MAFDESAPGLVKPVEISTKGRQLWRDPNRHNPEGGNANWIGVFKDFEDRTHAYASGPERILFFSGDSETGHKSFTVQRLNAIFAAGDSYFFERVDDRQIMCRSVSMLEALQSGYHTGKYPGTIGEYPYAQNEFPDRYRALVAGLSDKALEAIEQMDGFMSIGEDPECGRKFVAKLREDRHKMHNQIMVDARFDALRAARDALNAASSTLEPQVY